jgi:8-oxo-dGTP pyrophosphatase MutT (NUDIX family)
VPHSSTKRPFDERPIKFFGSENSIGHAVAGVTDTIDVIKRGRMEVRIVVTATLYQIEAQIRAALDDQAPRPDGHSALAPQPRRGWQVGVIPPGARHAAALLLLYPVNTRTHLVLTRRTGTLSQHPGQISLPGGAVDGSETIEGAALREAREEIGLQTHDLRILGRLSPLYIPVSNFALHPVVAVVDRRPTLVPTRGEVAGILEVPLDDLRDSRRLRRGQRWEDSEPITVPYFELQSERVWGATAMVLGELLHHLKGHEC